jgi:hypothetical protein
MDDIQAKLLRMEIGASSGSLLPQAYPTPLPFFSLGRKISKAYWRKI